MLSMLSTSRRALICGLALITALAALPVLPVQAAPVQEVELKDCQFSIGTSPGEKKVDAECGSISVPEDRANPDGRSLTINFTVLRAENADSGLAPIFHFEGGPGASAISNFGLAWYGSYGLLRRDHDIVLIDQRGTGTSAPLNCTETESIAVEDLETARDEEENIAIEIERLEECLTRLSEDYDPAFFTSDALAADTEAVREALGYDKINLFGNSYGTWLAQEYMRTYSEYLNAVILDSVTGPWNLPFLSASINGEASLLKTFALCESDTECDALYPDLESKLETVLENLEEEPVTVNALNSTGGAAKVIMTRARFLEGLRQISYSSLLIAAIPDMIEDATNDNYQTIAGILVSAAEQADTGATGLYFSVVCAETVAFLDEDVITSVPESRFFDTPSDYAQQIRTACEAWRSAELEADAVSPVQSDVPTLILEGDYDPITPVSFGEETRDRLPNSTLVVFPYQSHGVLAGSACAGQIAAAFLRDPESEVDTDCVADDLKPIFSGTYDLQLESFNGEVVSAQIPEGWTLLEETDNNMAYFQSEDGLSYIGVGKPTGRDLQQIITDEIEAQFGEISPQAQVNQLGVTVAQFTFVPKDATQNYTGVLAVFSFLGQTRVMFYAAPNNHFYATFEPIFAAVFASIQ